VIGGSWRITGDINPADLAITASLDGGDLV
jgi:hypothetical protein